MAKMRVHELAKELDKQSKDIIAFLQDKGYEIKAAQSSIEEDAIDLVRQKFGKEKVENAPKKEKNVDSNQGIKDSKADKTAQIKTAPENGQSVANRQQPETAKKQAAPENRNTASEEPKKKKKIIFVGNSQNSSMPGGRQGQGTGNGNRRPNDNNNRQTPQQQAPHKIIRPTQKPIPVTAEPYDVRQKQQQERRLEQKRQENREKANANVQNKPNTQEKPYNNNVSSNTNSNADNDNKRPKGQNRQGFNNNQGNNRGASFASGGNRNFNGSERPQKGNGGQDNRFKKGGSNKDFMPESPIKDTEKHRDEEKRRIGQEKDKRSKKDLIYEEDEIGSKNFNKPGRFIKPEKKVETPAEEKIKVITLPETLTIKDLADKMKIQPSAIIKKLFMQGQIVTVNSEISFEDAENIAIEYEIICEKEVKVNVIEELLKEEDEDVSTMVSRPPVICVMGHVDHGKTSLLDAIRKTNVTDKEAGGITQAIGAYTVNVNNQKITFLDTPGHEAFTAMRMRGANSTDIAVLVVAADDGVMPQTIEAINHAKAAGIEIIVAVNKIDKPSANIDRVKQELTEHELIPVDWGGSTEFVPVSAKSGEGIGTLLETILLTAEILELKANPNRRARGLVIEAELDKGRGPVATVLVQKGTLHVGDFISAGASHGKVRAMIDDKGRRVKEALPSMPVEILGLSDVPSAGEVFVVHENDKSAKSYADTYMSQYKEEMLADTKLRMSLDDLFNQIQEGNLKELNLIVKADVQGSVEALKQSLMKLSNDEIVVKCIHGGVGAINESDVTLASASSAIIIGFNVRPDATAKAIAEREGVDVRLYKVIYQAIDDIESAMKGMLDPIFEEKVIGHAEVRQIFKASAIGNIAGSYILDGEFQRGCKIRITREGEQIYEGSLASLKRFKDDVKEVKAGFECGLVFDGFDKMQELDIVEAYIMVEVPRT
ncbi:MAG: translation initiation factor IF-2 [Lachnospiraceae bacterium]|nr:translation initiation factor IF-2 [Lachnospiraceae bacterium]